MVEDQRGGNDRGLFNRPPRPASMIGGVALLVIALVWALSWRDSAAYASVPDAIFILITLFGVLWLTYGPTALLTAVAIAIGLYRNVDGRQMEEAAAVLKFASETSWGVGVVGALITLIAIASDLYDWGQAMATKAAVPLLYGSSLAVFIFAPLRQILLLRAAAESE